MTQWQNLRSLSLTNPFTEIHIFLEQREYKKVYDKLQHRYTIIVLYRISYLLYDQPYTTSHSFEPFDIQYDTTLCECRVAGVYNFSFIINSYLYECS
jgi:hypothetical protein